MEKKLFSRSDNSSDVFTHRGICIDNRPLIGVKIGGSIFLPNEIDTPYLLKFKNVIETFRNKFRFFIIVGGGHTARKYQNALKALGIQSDLELNKIGIQSTIINAKMFGYMFNASVLENKSDNIPYDRDITIIPGFDAGHSTDYDTMIFAHKYSAKKIIILSNISKIYDSDPKTNPNAKAFDKMRWSQLKKIVGTEFKPGSSHPIDPIAVSFAKERSLKVTFSDGEDLENFERILRDQSDYIGTDVE